MGPDRAVNVVRAKCVESYPKQPDLRDIRNEFGLSIQECNRIWRRVRLEMDLDRAEDLDAVKAIIRELI